MSEEYDGYDEEYDYNDEEDSGYRSRDSPRIEMGYNEQQFQGRMEHEDEGHFASEIAGGELGKLQRKRDLNMEPLEKFLMILNDEIRINQDTLGIQEADKKKMREVATDLPLIQHKNALFFLIGYYITKIQKRKELTERVLALTRNKSFVQIEVVKYAIFWQDH
jgi:hypothetical protein